VSLEPFRRRRAWRELDTASYSGLERSARRRRMIGYGAWSTAVMIAIAILLSQNGTG
jgi:hypothetical protein